MSCCMAVIDVGVNDVIPQLPRLRHFLRKSPRSFSIYIYEGISSIINCDCDDDEDGN